MRWFAIIVPAAVGLLTLQQLLKRLRGRRTKNGQEYDEIPELLSGKFPVLGTAIEGMLWKGDMFGLLLSKRKKLGDIFGTYLLGKRVIFVCDPFAAAVVYNKSRLLSFDPVEEEYSRKLFLQSEEGLAIDRQHNHEFHRTYPGNLLSPESLSSMCSAIQNCLPDVGGNLCPGREVAGEAWSSIDLLDAVGKIMYFATSVAVMGKGDEAHRAAVLDKMGDFFTFDNYFTQLSAGVPMSWLPGCTQAFEGLMSLFDSETLQLAPLLRETKAYGDRHNHPDTKKKLVAFWWASNGNSLPVCFWFVWYVLELGGKVLQDIMSEVDNLYATATFPFTAAQIESAVVLDAVLQETLRLVTSTGSMREAVADEVLELDGTRVLVHKGDRIMIPTALIARDERMFDKPDDFVWDRFLPDKTEGKPKFNKNGRPVPSPTLFFGGGNRMCPGRKIVTLEMKAVAMYLLHTYEMRIPEGVRRPDHDLTRHLATAVGPKQRVQIDIRRRVHT